MYTITKHNKYRKTEMTKVDKYKTSDTNTKHQTQIQNIRHKYKTSDTNTKHQTTPRR